MVSTSIFLRPRPDRHRSSTLLARLFVRSFVCPPSVRLIRAPITREQAPKDRIRR